MKAVRFHQHGGIDQLRYEEAPEPELSYGEVLIRVRACALNHLDLWIRQGQRGAVPLPHILGSDIAGILEMVAEGVVGMEPGRRVIVSPGLSCGRCRQCLSGKDNMCPSYSIIGAWADGGYAEYVKVPAVNVLPMPENLSYEEVAAFPLVFLTAWHMLVTRAHLQAGEEVLVHAAGSGVGSAAIQIAKLLGGMVITTAGSDEKLEKAKALGADAVINYAKTDFYEEVLRLTEGKGVDVVIDSVGSETFTKSLGCLAIMGRLVSCGVTSGDMASIDIRRVFSRQLNILGSYIGSKAELMEVLPLLGSRKLRPVVDRVLPLTEAAAAQRLMEERRNFGKIVLVP